MSDRKNAMQGTARNVAQNASQGVAQSAAQGVAQSASQNASQGVDLSLLDGVLQELGGDSGNLISVLQKAQEIYGYLPGEALRRIAEEMGSTPAKVLGVATFYAQFRLKPAGRYLVLLCKGTACHVNGADGIEKAVTEYLGIGDGGTTDDLMFSLKAVACLGCCSLSPVMTVNGVAYGSLTPEKAVAILKKLRKEGEKPCE